MREEDGRVSVSEKVISLLGAAGGPVRTIRQGMLTQMALSFAVVPSIGEALKMAFTSR